MPLALLVVVTVAMLLNKRVEGRLQSTIEEKELKTRDVVLLVVFMAIIISAIAYTALYNPGAVFENILFVFFLSSYTMLLFTISYVFSNLNKIQAQVLRRLRRCIYRGGACVARLAPLQDAFTIFRVAAFLRFSRFLLWRRGLRTWQSR